MRARCSRIAAGATLALCVLACVGENPDWDGPRELDPVLGDAAQGEQGEQGGATGDGTDTADPVALPPWTSGGGPEDELCLQQGLARCEDASTVVCVDLSRNPAHCGACFRRCDEIPGSTCIDGQCRCDGGMWWAACDGACREVKDDPHACGLGCVDCIALHGHGARCKKGVCRSDD